MENILMTMTPMSSDAVVTGLVGTAATIGAGLVAAFLIYSIGKSALEFSKGHGSTSIWSILGKVVFLILCIGLIFIAKDYTSLGDKAKDIGNKGLDSVKNIGDEIIGN